MAKQVLVLALLTLALAALATADTPNLGGRSFWSTGVTVDGEEKDLVPGTRIKLRFHEDGRLSVSAGCNSMQMEMYSIENGILTNLGGGMSMTEMGCEGGRMEQDSFVADYLSSQPMVVLEGNRLVLSTDLVTIDFLDRKVADPDRPLVGTEWIENGFFDKVVASKMSVDTPGWIKFRDDGKASYFNGCFEGELQYSSTSSDGVINLELLHEEPIVPCANSDVPEAYAAKFNQIFGEYSGSYSVSYEIDASRLKISNDNGDGVSFKAGDSISTTTSDFGNEVKDDKGESDSNEVKDDGPESSSRSNILTVSATVINLVIVFTL